MTPQAVLAAIILMFISSFIVACAEVDSPTAQAEQKIQGSWSFSEAVDEDFHASYSYTFEDGLVRFSGYPPLEWNGRYRILPAENNLITLELFDLEDEDGPRDSYTLDLAVDSVADAMMIGNKGPFTR
ncbi:hypothetical protein [Candidatus Leptofilum sp.]|uniref:hypothetical protein n=1 Tax=Candidatus Leptofilum sp. TaxID=3241576 RepID=UPI003B592A06